MKLKGEKMLEYSILFSFVVLFILVGLYILDNKDKGKAKDFFLETKVSLNSMKSDFEILTEAVDKTAITGASNEQRVNDILKRTEALEKEADATELMCLKLREGQSQLNDRISRKRPVIKMPHGPIAVEIYDNPPRLPKTNLGKGMKAILKDAAR